MHKKFNAPFLFWTEVPNHKKIKEYLLPEIKKEYSENQENYNIHWKSYVYTSIKHKNEFIKQDWILDSLVWNPLDQMFSEIEMSIPPNESHLEDIWWNYYPEGGYQEAHTHLNTSTTFSAAYLLDINEQNNTMFTDLSQMFFLHKELDTKDMKEGTVMIFPADLLHYVIPSKKERCTLSFNVSTTFTL